jgi:hypothetical protein
MKKDSSIRYICYPRTSPPPDFAAELVTIFQDYEKDIGTISRQKGLTSDEVLTILRPSLVNLGFQVEASKLQGDKIQRPVFFGEYGQPTLKYEIDAYNPDWKCGLEVEAARAWMGNAVYRDLIQALVMVQVDTLVLAVSNEYKYMSSKRLTISRDYDNTVNLAETLYGHSRIRLPFSLIVIGY